MKRARSKDRQTNVGGVIGSTKDQLWGPVVPAANIADVWFALYQYFGTAKSQSFKTPVAGLRRRFWGLMSLWHIQENGCMPGNGEVDTYTA